MKQLKLLTLMLVFALPLLTGCFGGGSGSSNPVGVSISGSAPTMDAAPSELRACKFTKPAMRKYTFAKSNYKVNYSFRAGVKKAAASLRLLLQGANSSDNIFITFDKVMVKSESGVKKDISLPARKIDLLAAGQLSEVLADIALTPSVYTQMELSIKEAELIDNGVTYKLYFWRGLFPKTESKIKFNGKYEIKDGYITNLTLKFVHRILKMKFFGKNIAIMLPTVKISSELVSAPAEPHITDGDISGSVENFVTAAKVSGVTVALDGTNFSAVTNNEGAFTFTEVPAGSYSLRASHPDYLDNSLAVSVEAGQVAAVDVQVNPAVIRSTVANTGWFSEFYPYADASGEYAEVGLEAPVNIDFVSLAFVKAEMKFTAEYFAAGSTICHNFLSATQQVSANTDLGSWWAGNTAATGDFLGEFYCTATPGSTYTIDVTEMIRSNPSSAYFFASKNLDLVNIRLTNIQLSVYYR